MRLGPFASAVAAISLAAGPVAAQTVERGSPASADEQDQLGGPSIILAILALAAIIAGIVIAAGSDDDSAVSP
jgi:hypothetical protein